MKNSGTKDTFRHFSLFPKTLSQSVEQVIKPVYKKHGFAEHRILTQWADIVGPELATCSVPEKLVFRGATKEGGTLHIVVASARALELQHMQPVIIEKIATYFGYPAVARLTFMQSTSAHLRKGKKPLPPAHTTSPSKALCALVETCEDADLKQALLSLGSALAREEN